VLSWKQIGKKTVARRKTQRNNRQPGGFFLYLFPEPISKFAFEAKGSGFERSEVKNVEEYRDISRNF